jgi:hypothetical protein
MFGLGGHNMHRKCAPIVAATAASVMMSALLILIADTANAQSGGRGTANVRMVKGGYCPLGTCNIYGGRMAINVRNCAASHCR